MNRLDSCCFNSEKVMRIFLTLIFALLEMSMLHGNVIDARYPEARMKMDGI